MLLSPDSILNILLNKVWVKRHTRVFLMYATAIILTTVCAAGEAQSLDHLALHLSLGNSAKHSEPFHVRISTAGGVTLRDESVWNGRAGAGHAETRTFEVTYPHLAIKPIQDLHVIWADLIEQSDADTAARLLQDPAARIDPRKIVIELNLQGSRGFTLTLDQLLNHTAFWIPSLDLYLTAGSEAPSFAEYQRQASTFKGSRVLDEVQRIPEATYEDFKQRWQDMGNPAYTHPQQEGPGHIVGLAWDSTIAKFGIDRGAGVWNDYGNPDHFRFWFGFGNLSGGIVPSWKSQMLASGLPIVSTIFERDRVRYDVEQFAYPLNGPSKERTGDLQMVLLQRVKMTDLSGEARSVSVTMSHERAVASPGNTDVIGEYNQGQLLLSDDPHRQTLLVVKAEGAKLDWTGVYENGQKRKRMDVTLSVNLPARGVYTFYVNLPSPVVDLQSQATLSALNYDAARAGTLKFWSSYLAQGAKFSVPEETVNDLFRANLWHALRLPRRHNSQDIDLPYSNFAYDQTGTPWPINQAVYVDYMLYGLRGYNDIATEEIQAIFKNNQEFNGKVDGFANWLAYTPGALYAVGENYLLSGDKASFEKLLPRTLKALDWSVAEIHFASTTPGATAGLVAGPLNDITGVGYWSFNQAYLYAGVDVMGRALEKYGDSRGSKYRAIAEDFRKVLEIGTQIATVHSPLVQLRDHTWIPYVPSDDNHPGRNYAQWYPSDVDTGALHLLRLKALPANGELADDLLQDHEDNLYLKQWGLANEPVYNQQATAYLLRDDAKATIRSFYSLMAGGFSHGALEPVEHRWRWGQYFGPPSTDGAWFELYRNMLVRERDDHTLILGQAAPRAWLKDGKEIAVEDTPTWFGKVTFNIKSHAARGSLEAKVRLSSTNPNTTVLVRLRHPQHKLLRSVSVNGKAWSDFDPKEEWVRIPNATPTTYRIEAHY